MAINNRKSSNLTNLDAALKIYPNRFDNGYYSRNAFGLVEAVADDIGSVYRLIRVPSRAVIKRLELASDDLGTSVTTNVGLYAADDGAVVDADFFASAVDVATAAVARTDITYESGIVDLADQGKQLWEQLGLTEDPGVFYDISAVVAGGAATGTYALWADVGLLD